VGSLLQPAKHLATSDLLVRLVEGTPRVRPHFEDLPPDVREHRDCDRQRTREPIRQVGQVDGTSVPAIVCRTANARASAALNFPKADPFSLTPPAHRPLKPATRPLKPHILRALRKQTPRRLATPVSIRELPSRVPPAPVKLEHPAPSAAFPSEHPSMRRVQNGQQTVCWQPPVRHQ